MADSKVRRSRGTPAGARAELLVSTLLEEAGWQVRQSAPNSAAPSPDLVVERGDISYSVEVKAASEGRSDRLIPLWSQAWLQAVHASGKGQRPLAVVAAPRIPARVAEQVLQFAAEYAPEAAAGVVDFAGLRAFRGDRLDDLNREAAHKPAAVRAVPGHSSNLFSDLDQWMLKVLLAPELPENLLSAPRGRYHNATQLARAAHVSVMSAFRLVQQLQRDGYLHESKAYLSLVRREDLFRHWQAAAARRVKEAPMRFILRGDPEIELRRMLRGGRACLGLFAAASALHLGFVEGVPPYVYVQRLSPANIAAW